VALFDNTRRKGFRSPAATLAQIWPAGSRRLPHPKSCPDGAAHPDLHEAASGNHDAESKLPLHRRCSHTPTVQDLLQPVQDLRPHHVLPSCTVEDPQPGVADPRLNRADLAPSVADLRRSTTAARRPLRHSSSSEPTVKLPRLYSPLRYMRTLFLVWFIDLHCYPHCARSSFRWFHHLAPYICTYFPSRLTDKNGRKFCFFCTVYY
jgi:hypothetical protein